MMNDLYKLCRNKLNSIFKKLDKKWYFSVLSIVILSMICFFGLLSSSIFVVYISFFFPLSVIFLAVFFGVRRLIDKKYLIGILQILCTIIISGIVYIFYSFILMFNSYDHFANNLEIPENIRFEKPINLDKEGKIYQLKINKKDIILYDGLQGGIYKYDVYLNKIEKGKVYLKIFEITENQILSEKEIKRKSEIAVENNSNILKKFSLKDDFTVYEGDWEDYYGSRIEVWFKPSEKNRPERKILTKNYIIQGWMR